MKIHRKHLKFSFLLIFPLMLALGACDDGDDLDDEMEEAAENMEDAAEETGDEIEEATD